ncbi:MAG: glycosyltransferase [Chloroflexi bacterium]|nr:glycosyltransferase [Chloroflexota bacterium]
MKVAIVHDWLNQWGGAEGVLEALHQIFPSAPVFTSIYVPQALPKDCSHWEIHTSFLQRFPGVNAYHRLLLPLYPLAFTRLRLTGYDVIISNSSGFCHGVDVPTDTCHINYCLTPPRYVWNLPQYVAREHIGVVGRLALSPLVGFLRTWDWKAAQKVSYFVGISKMVVDRIREFYGREADLIYPPVNTQQFTMSEKTEDYFLIVSRLVPYKRIDLAVRAFTQLKKPLYIVGDGRDRATLESMAGPTVRFLGRLPIQEVRDLMGQCKAFVFPGEEDFGIAPVEAQAAGRPVIAYRGGGALDSVIDGTTGLFFNEPTTESLVQAIHRFDKIGGEFHPPTIRRHAQSFDTAVFQQKMWDFVQEKIGRPEETITHR